MNGMDFTITITHMQRVKSCLLMQILQAYKILLLLSQQRNTYPVQWIKYIHEIDLTKLSTQTVVQSSKNDSQFKIDTSQSSQYHQIHLYIIKLFNQISFNLQFVMQIRTHFSYCRLL